MKPSSSGTFRFVMVKAIKPLDSKFQKYHFRPKTSYFIIYSLIVQKFQASLVILIDIDCHCHFQEEEVKWTAWVEDGASSPSGRPPQLSLVAVTKYHCGGLPERG